MVKVSNINIVEQNFIKDIESKKDTNLVKCIKLLSDENIDIQDIKKLLPNKSKFIVSFILSETCSEIANGIRRCLLNETPVYSLDFDEYKDFDSNDAYILNDHIKKQIELLPIYQELEEKNVDKIKVKLSKYNHSDELQNITTSDMESISPHKISEIINPNIILGKLRPGKHIVIENIKIIKDIGQNNSGKFNLVGPLRYEILDQNHIQDQKGVSSLLSNPTKFLIGYSTHRNIKNPKYIMTLCCDTLLERLNMIYEDMKNIDDDDEQYFSDLLELETMGNIKKIRIKNEYWTIVSIISKYCFMLNKNNDDFFIPSVEHPDENISILKTSHSQFSTIIRDSLKKIIFDISVIKKYFV